METAPYLESEYEPPGDECPAGGDHNWETLTDWEAGPAERGGTRCAECGKGATEAHYRRWRQEEFDRL